MRLLDPNGVQKRTRGRLVRRQYQNPDLKFVWHIDAYDKLKPYSIAISGCIDGYSRYVIWLEAVTMNSDPRGDTLPTPLLFSSSKCNTGYHIDSIYYTDKINHRSIKLNH